MDKVEKMREMAERSFEYTNICILLLPELKLRGDKMRYCVSLTQLMASMDFARSAFLLVAKDPHRSWMAARVLFRTQTDLLMRGAFFAGPATDDEYKYFEAHDELPKRDGNRLGPKSLAKINNAYFKLCIDGNMELVISDDWGPTSALAHGGHHLLGRYIHDKSIGMHSPDPEFHRHLNNSMIHAAYAIHIIVNYLAINKDEKKKEIDAWEMATNFHFAQWATRRDTLVDGFSNGSWWEQWEQ